MNICWLYVCKDRKTGEYVYEDCDIPLVTLRNSDENRQQCRYIFLFSSTHWLPVHLSGDLSSICSKVKLCLTSQSATKNLKHSHVAAAVFKDLRVGFSCS